MKTTNRLLAVLLSLVLLCSALPFAFAEDVTIVDSGTCGKNLTWTLDSAGALTINGTGSMYDYKYEKYDEDGIYCERTSAPWGKFFKTIQAVVLEDGVTSIGWSAFSGCTALKSVTIPDSVTSIGSNAFYNCTALTSVTIPDSVTSIGGNAFGSSNGPQPLLLCNKDSYAASWAESNGYPYALLDGTDEENIISETVNAKLSYSIDKRTRTLTVLNQGKLISFSSYNAPWCKYQQYVETAILSDGCTSVSEQAFYGCYNLKRVVLPETVETIDASAFDQCVSLQDITIPNAVTSIGDSAFYNCASMKTATIGNSVTSIGYSAFRYCSSLQSATIGDGVTSIGSYAFSNCSFLQNIVLPEGLQSIGSYAFYYCESLQSIVIPDSVTYMGDYETFENCTSLKSVVIGDGLTTIPSYAFSGCTALETVSIGDNVTRIYDSAFSGCSKLSTVLFGEKVQDIYQNAFGGCSSLPAVDLPASVRSIGPRAFSDSALKDITIRNKNCEINKDAISIYATIHGYAGSTAEQFADDYGYYFNEITDAAPHDHDRTLVKGYDPTCTAAGLTDGWQCSVCGIWFEKQKPVKALGHDYIPVETQEPTETEPGFVRYECTRCDSAYTETLPVTTHTHSFNETERKDASCLEDGFVTYTCATCGYSYTDLLVASGHSFGAWRTFLPVEAGEKGVEIRFCAVCAAYELRESDAVSPGGGTGTPTDPTHTHNFVLVDAKDATCDLAGYNRYMCTCGQSKADILDPLGHIWKLAKVIDPTCEKAGCTDYICGRCGALHQDNYTDPLGHDYQVEQVAPTCTARGHIVTSCTRCGNKLNDWQDLPALGHIDTDGNGICDRCKQSMTDPGPHVHHYNEAADVPAVAATCTTPGHGRGWTCTDPTCTGGLHGGPYVMYEAGNYPALGHLEEVIPAVAATCTTAGSTAGKKCTRPGCGKILVAPQTVSALGHVDEDQDGICDRCKESAVNPKVRVLKSIYDQIPVKNQWYQFIDTTELAKFYNDATAILAAPDTYTQANVDMIATNLKAAWEAIRYHTTDVVISSTSLNVGVGETVVLTASLLPAKAGDPVQWITNAPDVATVTGSGENNTTATVKVLKYSAVDVKITAISNGKHASCTLYIGNPIDGIRLSSTTLNVSKGQTVKLEATPYGADQSAAMSDAVTSTLWTTSNASVATVSDNGIVTAVGEGNATIKVTMISGDKTLEATCSVTVVEPDPEDEEPQGFFAKIGAFFKNLFDRIFSIFKR